MFIYLFIYSFIFIHIFFLKLFIHIYTFFFLNVWYALVLVLFWRHSIPLSGSSGRSCGRLEFMEGMRQLNYPASEIPQLFTDIDVVRGPSTEKTVDSLTNAFLRWSNFLLQAFWILKVNSSKLIFADRCWYWTSQSSLMPWQSHDGASLQGELLKRLSELETCKT